MSLRTALGRVIACLSVSAILTVICSRPTTILAHPDDHSCMAASSNGKNFAWVSEGDKRIYLWDLIKWRAEANLPGPNGGVRCLAFSPDGTKVALGCADYSIHVHDTATGAELTALKGHTDAIHHLVFGPDGATLASGSSDTTVKLWDVKTGKQRTTLRGHSSRVVSLAFSPDGETLASGSTDKIIRLWEVATGKERSSLKGHSYDVRVLAFSPDGKTLASGSWDGTLKLWDTASGEKLFLEDMKWLGEDSAAYPEYIAFSADGKALAAGTAEVIGLWSLTTGKNTASYGWNQRPFDWSAWSILSSFGMIDKGHSRGVRSVWFTPAGKLMALGREDDSFQVWQVTAFPITGIGLLYGVLGGLLVLPAVACLRWVNRGMTRRTRSLRPALVPSDIKFDQKTARSLRCIQIGICVAMILLVVMVLACSKR